MTGDLDAFARGIALVGGWAVAARPPLTEAELSAPGEPLEPRCGTPPGLQGAGARGRIRDVVASGRGCFGAPL